MNMFKKPFSQLGLPAEDQRHGSDAEFYAWINGKNADEAFGSVLAWMLEDLKDEPVQQKFDALLKDWCASHSPEEQALFLRLLNRMVPPGHKLRATLEKFQAVLSK